MGLLPPEVAVPVIEILQWLVETFPFLQPVVGFLLQLFALLGEVLGLA